MKRIAVIATVYRYLSHAQHIGDRFLVGYPHGGTWRRPDMKVVFFDEWGEAPERLKGAAGILRTLVGIAEQGTKAA